MKKILALTLSIILFSCQPQQPKHSWNIGTDGYVEGTSDIPLAKGLKKFSDDNLGFDSTDGSIVSITYKSKIELQKVYGFYAKTLPQLGWVRAKSKQPNFELLRFKRENERLEIEFSNKDGVDLVKFYIETVSD